MKELNVIKNGQVYKVQCPKTGEKTLIVTCHDCDKFKGYENKKIKCEG